jgi:hypothetical protein
VTERANVDQRYPTVAAQQDDRAPAEATMADGFSRISLHKDVELIVLLFHDGLLRYTLPLGSMWEDSG